MSIKKYGQQEPILVRPKHDVTSEVEYEVIFGNRRWRACASLNIPVKAIIKSLTDQEAAISQKEENENREGISDYSKAIFYKKMLDNKIFSSIGSLANNMGIGKSTLLDLLSYTRISQEIISAMPNPHKLSRKAAAKLATLSSANKDTIENLILLAPDIVAGKIPARKIESELNKRLNPDYVQNLTKALFSLTTHNNGDLTIFIPKDQVKNINLEELNNLLTEHFNLKKQPVGRPTINL
ncbi:MAG: ParB/RepB/Spo0J family partition protein [Gammaproteobacteria bacterium]